MISGQTRVGTRESARAAAMWVSKGVGMAAAVGFSTKKLKSGLG